MPDLTDAKIPGIYRLDIQQGNVITAEEISRLELGMPKRKVSHLIGTPAVQDVFHEDRWDYVYTFQKGGGEREQRAISVFFENGKLARIQGDTKSWQSSTPPRSTDRVVEVPPQSRRRSIIGALNPWSEESKRARAREAIREKREAEKQRNGTAAKKPTATAAVKPAPAPSSQPAPKAQASQPAGNPKADVTAAPTKAARASPPSARKSSLFKRLSERFKLETVPPTSVDPEFDEAAGQ